MERNSGLFYSILFFGICLEEVADSGIGLQGLWIICRVVSYVIP
jgi:hypothetical protein